MSISLSVCPSVSVSLSWMNMAECCCRCPEIRDKLSSQSEAWPLYSPSISPFVVHRAIVEITCSTPSPFYAEPRHLGRIRFHTSNENRFSAKNFQGLQCCNYTVKSPLHAEMYEGRYCYRPIYRHRDIFWSLIRCHFVILNARFVPSRHMTSVLRGLAIVVWDQVSAIHTMNILTYVSPNDCSTKE